MSPASQADLVVAVHLAVVVFMVAMTLALPAALLASRLRRRPPPGWARSPWLRWPHLGVFLYMAINAARGELCFLTTWESRLRWRAGQTNPDEYSFVGRLLHDLLFVDVPIWALNGVYVALFVLTLVLVFLLPPRRGWRAQGGPVEEGSVQRGRSDSYL